MAYVAILILSTAIIYQANGQTCSWSFTQPSDVTVDYLIESGESAYFNVLVASEVLTYADRVTWKLNDVDIAILRYSSLGLFQLLSNERGIASAEPGNYSLIIPSINETDDGAQITVISGGCTVKDVSPRITLRVISPFTTTAPSTASNATATDTPLVTESEIATTAATAAVTTPEMSTIHFISTRTSSVVSTTENIASTSSGTGCATQPTTASLYDDIGDEKRAWINNILEWRENVAEWKHLVERECFVNEIDSYWTSLFKCPDFPEIQCVNQKAWTSTKDPFNCTIAFCEDGRYTNNKVLQIIYRDQSQLYKSVMAIYKEDLTQCKKRKCTESSTETILTTNHPTTSDPPSTTTPAREG